MAQYVKLSAAEYERKKAAIGGVIDFNDACGISYSRVKLFKHFGIGVPTGYQWFPIAPSATGRPRKGARKIKSENKSLGLKRSRSEDPGDQLSALKAEPDVASAPLRQNPVRNGGRDRKRLKAIVEELTEHATSVSTPPPVSPPSSADSLSPTPARQLLTPPKGRRGRPEKRLEPQFGHEAQRSESVIGLKYGDVDDDAFSEV